VGVLKSLGVWDLQYKTAFFACIIHDPDGWGGTNIRGKEEEGEDDNVAHVIAIGAKSRGRDIKSCTKTKRIE